MDAPCSAVGSPVVINATKPRKGAFVVRVDGAEEPIVELLDLPLPFIRLKSLDIEGTIATLIELVTAV